MGSVSQSPADTRVHPEHLARRDFHKHWDLHRNSGAPGTTRTCDTRFRKPGYHCPATYGNQIVFSDSRSGSLSTLFHSLCLGTTRFATQPASRDRAARSATSWQNRRAARTTSMGQLVHVPQVVGSSPLVGAASSLTYAIATSRGQAPETQRKQFVPSLRNHAREEPNLAVPPPPTATK